MNFKYVSAYQLLGSQKSCNNADFTFERGEGTRVAHCFAQILFAMLLL